MQDRFGQLHRITPSGYDLFAMQWHRISGRFYYVLEAPAHRSVLRDRAEAMLKTCWREHFKLIPPHG